MTHRILILALLTIAVIGCDDVKYLDNCATDTQCAEAAERHCAAGEAGWCE